MYYPEKKEGSAKLLAGLMGFAAGSMFASRPQIVTQTQIVPVAVEVPVEVERSQSEMAMMTSPAVQLWFVTFYHLAGVAEQIAEEEGINLDPANRQQIVKYLTKARGRIGNDFGSMIRSAGADPKLFVPALELMEGMFAALKANCQAGRI